MLRAPYSGDTAAYLRLSREDGDKLESDSIANQRKLIELFVAERPELSIGRFYIDDDYTGTNFNRPGFRDMLSDIQSGTIKCVIVKDLSRFGRDYIDTGNYLERVFPQHGVRFIAINDNIDSARSQYDMLLPIKNIFNEQYSRDISRKVKSSFKAKQQSGEFVGAFAGYGYVKSPRDRHKLEIDPPAAAVVQRVFDLFESGVGKIKIAKVFNEEGLPCPSEYKRLVGLGYHNGQRLEETAYWTYSTIDRILKNEMYIGNMVQSRYGRDRMHGKAHKLDKDDWVIVENTHEAIIDRAQWERVQLLLKKRGRSIDFEQNLSPFAGFLKCGDCGRAMAKTKTASGVYYSCGSYKRYGPSVCSKRSIRHNTLEQIVLYDINKAIEQVKNLSELAESSESRAFKADRSSDAEKLRLQLRRIQRLKQSAYEDHKEDLISKADFLSYRADYELKEVRLQAQLEQLDNAENCPLDDNPWLTELLEHGMLTSLDRATLSEILDKILIFEGGGIEISYRFAKPQELSGKS